MFKKKGLLLLAGSLITVGAWAQDACGTDEVSRQLRAKHPQIAEIEERLEDEIRQKAGLLDFSALAKTTSGTDTTYYDVPIVIHIVHDYGAEYVSDNAVFDAVQSWAEAFVGANSDTSAVIPIFKPYIGNSRIRLHLATKDPQGNPTKGITRTRSYLTDDASDQAKLSGWPNNQYINIWIINKFNDDQSGAAAYAYYPSMGAWIPYYDGIISLYNYLDYDKAMEHEIGHVLNLQHVWGNNNSPGSVCGDDQVQDTPPTKGHLPAGCTAGALYDVTCAVNYQVSTPNGIIDYPDTTNAQNIMDYTYCQRMFTHGQGDRMRAALTSTVAGRNNLFSPVNLAATGALAPRPDLPPVADFSVEKVPLAMERVYFLCANDVTKFSFKNRSWNDTITNVSWTFSNGADNPTSTSMTAVSNQFSQPGWVTVSLTATGNNSGSTTYTNEKAVYVADNDMLQPGGYVQNFASATDHDNWPYFNYYNNHFRWEWYNGAGYDDNSSMRFISFDSRPHPENMSGAPGGDFDDLITPGFDLSGFAGSNLNLNFYTAGARSGAGSDSMQILISVDCGRIWRRIGSIKGAALANNGSVSSQFVPNSQGQWKAQTVAVPANYLSYDKAFFKFRYWANENGNNVYLDKFSLTPWTTEVTEVAAEKTALKVYPNPSGGQLNLAFRTQNEGKVSFEIKDMTGKLIHAAERTFTPNTLVTTTLEDVFPVNGIYLLTVTNGQSRTTEKLTIVK